MAIEKANGCGTLSRRSFLPVLPPSYGMIMRSSPNFTLDFRLVRVPCGQESLLWYVSNLSESRSPTHIALLITIY